jgi:uncharacterized protein with GYD domain
LTALPARVSLAAPDAHARGRHSDDSPDKEAAMATYISLVSFTEQGIRNVKESPARAEAFKALATKLGVTVKSIHYTVGAYDLVTTVEGSDDAVTTLLLKVCSLGNVKTHTMRAYTTDEMARMIGNMP